MAGELWQIKRGRFSEDQNFILKLLLQFAFLSLAFSYTAYPSNYPKYRSEICQNQLIQQTKTILSQKREKQKETDITRKIINVLFERINQKGGPQSGTMSLSFVGHGEPPSIHFTHDLKRAAEESKIELSELTNVSPLDSNKLLLIVVIKGRWSHIQSFISQITLDGFSSANSLKLEAFEFLSDLSTPQYTNYKKTKSYNIEGKDLATEVSSILYSESIGQKFPVELKRGPSIDDRYYLLSEQQIQPLIASGKGRWHSIFSKAKDLNSMPQKSVGERTQLTTPIKVTPPIARSGTFYILDRPAFDEYLVLLESRNYSIEPIEMIRRYSIGKPTNEDGTLAYRPEHDHVNRFVGLETLTPLSLASLNSHVFKDLKQDPTSNPRLSPEKHESELHRRIRRLFRSLGKSGPHKELGVLIPMVLLYSDADRFLAEDVYRQIYSIKSDLPETIDQIFVEARTGNEQKTFARVPTIKLNSHSNSKLPLDDIDTQATSGQPTIIRFESGEHLDFILLPSPENIHEPRNSLQQVVSHETPFDEEAELLAGLNFVQELLATDPNLARTKYKDALPGVVYRLKQLFRESPNRTVEAQELLNLNESKLESWIDQSSSLLGQYQELRGLLNTFVREGDFSSMESEQKLSLYEEVLNSYSAEQKKKFSNEVNVMGAVIKDLGKRKSDLPNIKSFFEILMEYLHISNNSRNIEATSIVSLKNSTYGQVLRLKSRISDEHRIIVLRLSAEPKLLHVIGFAPRKSAYDSNYMDTINQRIKSLTPRH